MLACLQDLSQAKARWGPAADGFFSLFGTKVLLPGIGDMRTLEAVSRLAGQADVVVRSVNTSPWWTGHPSASTTRSPRLQARLPVDEAHSLPAGTALVIAGARPPQPAYLTRWWDYPPFSDARLARLPANLAPSWQDDRCSRGRHRRQNRHSGSPLGHAATTASPSGQPEPGERPHFELAGGAGPAASPPSASPALDMN